MTTTQDTVAELRRTLRWLGSLAKLRVRRSEANQRVGAAERFQPRTTMTGERLAPLFPVVAGALRDGVLSMDHATVIATSIAYPGRPP